MMDVKKVTPAPTLRTRKRTAPAPTAPTPRAPTTAAKPPPPPPARLLVDAKTAAELLSISAKEITRLRQRGVLPCVRIGRRALYPVASLAAYVESLLK